MYNIECAKVLKARHKSSNKVVEFIRVGNTLDTIYFQFLGFFYTGERITSGQLEVYCLNHKGTDMVVKSGSFIVKTDIGATCYHNTVDFNKHFLIAE